MGSFNFWLCIGVTALAIAGTYIIWGPSNRPKRKKKDFVPGLQNLGNSCFLNAVLQALSSCASCIQWLMKADVYAAESQQYDKYPLIKSVLSILSALNGSDDHCSGAEVIKALRAHRWIISSEEQDAHELFHVLTSTIEEELIALKPVMSLLDAQKLEEENKDFPDTQKPFISPTKTVPPKLASPIQGLLVNELKCSECKTKNPVKYDTFDSISLVIPSPNWGRSTLQELLLKFISCELVQDVECGNCSKLNPTAESGDPTLRTTFTKQLSFGKLPPCLCFHIQRIVWLKNGLQVKCYDHVAFPEMLVMDQFVHSHSRRRRILGAAHTRLTGGNAARNEPIKKGSLTSTDISVCSTKEEYLNLYSYVYVLQAVIVHLGDTTSGHFLTYRHVGERWMCISDLDVREVPFSQVTRATAYMLFYERIQS